MNIDRDGFVFKIFKSQFRKGGVKVDVATEIEEMILTREMRILGDDAMNNYTRASECENAPRVRMFEAQVVLIHQMYSYLEDDEENWRWSNFRNKLDEVIELQYSLYQEARSNDNRDMSLITLGRLRALRTLARRLNDPKRQREMAYQSVLSRFSPNEVPAAEGKPLE